VPGDVAGERTKRGFDVAVGAPLLAMRLPPSAKQIATEPTAIAQTKWRSGAYGPMFAASAAGTTNYEAPTTIPMVLAARPHGPTARISPASRRLVSMGRHRSMD